MKYVKVKFRLDPRFKQAFQDMETVRSYIDSYYLMNKLYDDEYIDSGVLNDDMLNSMRKDQANRIRRSLLNSIDIENREYTLQAFLNTGFGQDSDKDLVVKKDFWLGMDDSPVKRRILKECKQYRKKQFGSFGNNGSSVKVPKVLDYHGSSDMYGNEIAELMSSFPLYMEDRKTGELYGFFEIPMSLIPKLGECDIGFNKVGDIITFKEGERDSITAVNNMFASDEVNTLYNNYVLEVESFTHALYELREYLGVFGAKDGKVIDSITLIKKNYADRFTYPLEFEEENGEIHFVIPATRKRYGADIRIIPFDKTIKYKVKVDMTLRSDLADMFNTIDRVLNEMKANGQWINEFANFDSSEINMFECMNEMLNTEYTIERIVKDAFSCCAVVPGMTDEVKGTFLEESLCNDSFWTALITYLNIYKIDKMSIAGGKWTFEGVIWQTKEKEIHKWINEIKRCSGGEIIRQEIKEIKEEA